MTRQSIACWQLYDLLKQRFADLVEQSSAGYNIGDRVHAIMRPAGTPTADPQCQGLGYAEFGYSITPLQDATNWDVEQAHGVLQNLQAQHRIVTTS